MRGGAGDRPEPCGEGADSCRRIAPTRNFESAEKEPERTYEGNIGSERSKGEGS